jgi:hypothetical protein
MSKGRQRSSPRKGQKQKDEDWPELMQLSQAVRYLGVSHQKMTTLVRKGILPYSDDELDHRVKLVKKADLEALKQRRSKKS